MAVIGPVANWLGTNGRRVATLVFLATAIYEGNEARKYIQDYLEDGQVRHEEYIPGIVSPLGAFATGFVVYRGLNGLADWSRRENRNPYLAAYRRGREKC
jgi:hypothetical protein